MAADQDTVSQRLDEAVQACAPEDTVVTGYVLVLEYIDADQRYMDLVSSDGMTPWLRDGLLENAQGWVDEE